MGSDLGAAEENDGMVEECTVFRLNGFEFVHESGKNANEHFIAVVDDLCIGIVDGVGLTAFVVEVVCAAESAACFFSPDLVFLVVGSAFAAEAMCDDACHVGLEGKGDEVDHEFEMFLHTVFALRLGADGGFVELWTTAIEDRFLVVKTFFDIPD